MPYCPNCKILVTGNKCPRCGMVIAQPQTQMPPPPPPPPQQQGRPPYTPIQQPQAQPYAQTPYPTPIPQQPTTPQKKSKKGAVAVVVIVVALLLIASLAYLFFINPTGEDKDIPTITYDELLNDIEVSGSSSVTFGSYDDGDELYIVGTVEKIRMADVPSGVFGVKSGTWTIIYFESDNLMASAYNMFAYNDDLRSEYTLGEEGKIKIEIVELSIMGYDVEYPKEWQDAFTIQEYIEVPNVTLQFTQTTAGNYTGSVTSGSDSVPLEDLEIEIYDSSEYEDGQDDYDLTDDDPEVIDTYWADLYLEYRDVNDNDILDASDTFNLYLAEPGDTVTLIDSETYNTITVYAIT